MSDIIIYGHHYEPEGAVVITTEHSIEDRDPIVYDYVDLRNLQLPKRKEKDGEMQT